MSLCLASPRARRTASVCATDPGPLRLRFCASVMTHPRQSGFRLVTRVYMLDFRRVDSFLENATHSGQGHSRPHGLRTRQARGSATIREFIAEELSTGAFRKL
jgi:hypothetical protein